MIRRLVIFLIRKKLKVKKHQMFQFANQKSKIDIYWFEKDCLVKLTNEGKYLKLSGVSLNWLLDDECEIMRLPKHA